MSANGHACRRLVAAPATLLAALVLAGCGGPAEIAPTTPSADEIRDSERALEAAAAAEKSALPAGD